MARTIHYKIVDDAQNIITDEEWEKLLQLQHWYNSEFIWTAGRLALKMFAVFLNGEHDSNDGGSLVQKIIVRKRELRKKGYTENLIIRQLVSDGYVIAKKGGYADNCLASGFTKVAGNEFNAYLVCEFLVKASLIAKNAEFSVFDQGNFIKTHHIKIHNGVVRVSYDAAQKQLHGNSTALRKVFSVVNPQKYDDFPKFRTLVTGFNELDNGEKQDIVKDWNWLGFAENYDINGDDIQGFDLNRKVLGFEVV